MRRDRCSAPVRWAKALPVFSLTRLGQAVALSDGIDVIIFGSRRKLPILLVALGQTHAYRCFARRNHDLADASFGRRCR